MSPKFILEPIKWLAFQLVLRHIIRRDYRLRSQGRRPDKFHWADAMALRWGYWIEFPEHKTRRG